MDRSMRNQTLVAAAVAKQHGFENTYKALIEIVQGLDNSNTVDVPPIESTPSDLTERQLKLSLSIG